GSWGEVLTNIVQDIASGGLITDLETRVYADNLKRSHTINHLDGPSETLSYACCGLDSQTDRDGVTTQYTYDAAKRRVATTRLGITTTNMLDAAGRSIKTIRIGTDASQIRLSSGSYGVDGEALTQTNALDGITTFL